VSDVADPPAGPDAPQGQPADGAAAAGGHEPGAHALLLDVLAVHLQVCRLNHDAPIPSWLPRTSSPLTAIVRTADELSIVCPAAEVPADVRHEGPWRALRVAGPLDFALVGILTRLTAPLAAAGISIFALSTFDTDYVLVRAGDLDAAVSTLRDAGHAVRN